MRSLRLGISDDDCVGAGIGERIILGTGIQPGLDTAAGDNAAAAARVGVGVGRVDVVELHGEGLLEVGGGRLAQGSEVTMTKV